MRDLATENRTKAEKQAIIYLRLMKFLKHQMDLKKFL